ncbi:MAG: serine/threonine-protein phosphatase [Halioglobus sp.]|nr:serine/threonine-protein phosphatase [Halioglobus sp.]
MTDTSGNGALKTSGYTDVGKRKHNEDAFLIDRELGLYVVADGVGGHHSGEVASALTIEVIQREVAAGKDLDTAIQAANQAVIEGVSSGKGKAGMATTVVALKLSGTRFEVAWIGDSRAYLWDGKLALLTRDHSFVEMQLAAGRITQEEARVHPRRHVIMQAIGLQMEGRLNVGHNSGELGEGNSLLLCSDGVTDPLDSEQLSHLLGRDTALEQTCNNLVETALQCGGKDNATAVVLAYHRDADKDLAPGSAREVVWVYNPDTGEYEGLPDTTPEINLEETQVMRVSPSSAKPEEAHDSGGHAGGIGWQYIWGVAIVGTALGLALVYALG